MASTPIEALAALAESLGAEAATEDLERALPIVSRTLANALRQTPLEDLGETEPAFGLRLTTSD